MSSKRTEPRSIASQLVLLFTLAAALLLSCGLGVFYLIVVRHAFEEDNVFLSDKVLALRADLTRAEWPQILSEELKGQRAGEQTAYWVRVVDRNGTVMAETPGMGNLLPTNVFPAGENGAGLTTRDYRTGNKFFSLAATNGPGDRQNYTIQVAQDRSADEQFSKQFGILLLTVLVCGIGAAALIAITVTKRGLRPLAQMTASLQRVGPAHLHERMEQSRWPKELRPLAIAFDEMLDRLQDSFTRLSQFSADLAHELRTPVANILGESQVALTRARVTDEYRQVIESNAAECERLSALIDRLLFLARADATEERIERAVFDGGAAMAKIASFYETVAEEQQVTIDCTGHGDVYADEELFARAVSNLVENAFRFTTAGGKISLSLTSGTSGAEIAVSDTGSGIPAEHIARVFDRFYRVEASRSSRGTGLGLALVKSIVDLHGGSAVVQSELNRGTTVTLTFPRQQREPT
ncbi:MAG: heavy metal sensor histidine kinase [Chthoniobacterales bacterium]